MTQELYNQTEALHAAYLAGRAAERKALSVDIVLATLLRLAVDDNLMLVIDTVPGHDSGDHRAALRTPRPRLSVSHYPVFDDTGETELASYGETPEAALANLRAKLISLNQALHPPA